MIAILATVTVGKAIVVVVGLVVLVGAGGHGRPSRP